MALSLAPSPSHNHAVAAIRSGAVPLTGGPRDYDDLLDLVGPARIVLLGESSHGTHEFYRERSRITKRLITELGFSAIAIEGDFPAAHRVHRYVVGGRADASAEEALRGYRRFPTWMWRNAETLDLVGWLRAHNDELPKRAQRVGFFGLDIYSLETSMDAVIRYLDRVDPIAAGRARWRYECLRRFAPDGHEYGRAILQGVTRGARRRVFDQLVELRRSAGDYLRRDDVAAEDEQFLAERNAEVVADAGEYYRTMFGHHAEAWNLRERHMADTLDRLATHLDNGSHRGRVVVWAHNTHVGDARATEMRGRDQLSLGQLVRERHGQDARLVGLTTCSGTVTAAPEWGAPPVRMRVRPALPGSHEALCHAAGVPDFLVCPSTRPPVEEALHQQRPQRAVGVVYRPSSELHSHWFTAAAAEQFDALVHLDVTRALEPLERTQTWELGEPPETYPTAL